MTQIWAGVDIGKAHHHCVVIDADGKKSLSRRVANDETALVELIWDVLDFSGDVLWAIDVNHGGAALLVGLLINHDQPVAYLTGLVVHLASATYRGEGKTDAKDGFVIADQARMRRDLPLLRPGDDIAVDLRILTARRTDLVQDRTRAINRLRGAGGLPRPGTNPGSDESRASGAVDQIPDSSSDPSRRHTTHRNLAAWP